MTDSKSVPAKGGNSSAATPQQPVPNLSQPLNAFNMGESKIPTSQSQPSSAWKNMGGPNVGNPMLPNGTTAGTTPPNPPAAKGSLFDVFSPMLSKTLETWQAVSQWWQGSDAKAPVPQPLIITPEQKRWMENVEQYAESPFEKQLFLMKKRDNSFPISFAWANALGGKDAITRDAALSLLKSFLVYAGQDSLEGLSSHTQMKLMLFSTHLNEGLTGKAIIYQSLASVPMEQIVQFQNNLIQDFSKFPSIAQAVILKAYLKRLREMSNQEKAQKEEASAFRSLVKQMVIGFYSGQHERLYPELRQQEKIRLGFLKFQPIQQDFVKSLDEIEKQYRVRLRKLKNRKKLKVAEAEEMKRRRIEIIYDTIERDLVAGLEQLDIQVEQLKAV